MLRIKIFNAQSTEKFIGYIVEIPEPTFTLPQKEDSENEMRSVYIDKHLERLKDLLNEGYYYKEE